ncbi:hypothetical protein [Paenibacillus pini]|uniref:Adhesin domain-containing protein n=1 Tax=Paenibacillus pini JCM 16418 TaxID=1236976 RepID=W7Z783_9BACL|nr:hypothetical protein [Paenibacillus pini]GAF10179.1 hypothetical protein JCM16418_4356 [Paenibacillus pini JCM 16418]
MNTPLKSHTPTRRIGRWTISLGLISVGVIIALQMSHILTFEVLKYVWPGLLIMLGIELITANVLHSGERIRMGGLSIVILILLLLASSAQTLFPGWSSIFSPGYLSHAQGNIPINHSVKVVRIHLPEGKVHVTGISESTLSYEGDLSINASSQTAADEKFKTQWKTQQTGDVLNLQLEGNGPQIHIGIALSLKEPYLNVKVPSHLKVEVDTSDGSINAEQLDSDFTARTSNASVKLTDITGSIYAKSSNGSFTIHNIAGETEFITSNSSVHLTDITGNVSAKSTNGSIVVNNITGAAKLTTTNASMTLNQITNGVIAHTTNGSIKGESSIGGDWDCKTTNSSIHLKIPKDTNAKLTANTSNASIKGDISWVKTDDNDDSTAILGNENYKINLDTTNDNIEVVH